MKILLVEDSATLRFAMNAYIREAGHETVFAENGETAVQLLESAKIDMIIMDVEMPGLNGFETTRLIRESLGERWIPIIFVTGKNDDESLEKGIAVGGDDYLIKPVSKVILRAKIRAMERIANMRDQLHQLNDKLTNLSQRDSLTQLFNRRTFTEKADEAWRHAARTKDPLTVLLFDIDYFKRYNDCYGHLAGDECIRQVSKVLQGGFNRPGDVVARYGGEEFIVLLPGTHREGAEHLTDALHEQIEALALEHKESYEYARVTISVGGCTLKFTTGTRLDQVIEFADKALYESKNRGRNRTTLKEFKNRHTVLYMDSSPGRTDRITEELRGHCHLIPVGSLEELENLNKGFVIELIIAAIDRDDDPILAVIHQFRDCALSTVSPLLILSSLEKSEVKKLGKDVGANGSLPDPVDTHTLVAKIDQFLEA